MRNISVRHTLSEPLSQLRDRDSHPCHRPARSGPGAAATAPSQAVGSWQGPGPYGRKSVHNDRASSCLAGNRLTCMPLALPESASYMSPSSCINKQVQAKGNRGYCATISWHPRGSKCVRWSVRVDAFECQDRHFTAAVVCSQLVAVRTHKCMVIEQTVHVSWYKNAESVWGPVWMSDRDPNLYEYTDLHASLTITLSAVRFQDMRNSRSEKVPT